MRKVISIILYVISGFFFYTVCLIAFLNNLPILIKYAVMGVLCIPAVIALGIGLVSGCFGNWKRDIGIVITSAAGFALLVALTMACIFLSPEFEEFFHYNKADLIGLYSDYVSGFGSIAILGTTGIFLIWSSRKNVKRDVSQCLEVP